MSEATVLAPLPAASPQVEYRRHHPLEPWTYALLDAHQRGVAARARSGSERGALLMSELEPVVTYGRRTELETDLLVSREEFVRAEVGLQAVDRGGFATYHGPGQWVAFPVDRLERLMGDSRAVRRSVEGLCQAALEVALRHRPDARILEGERLGVWSESAGGKLASVGIHVEQGVLLHGVALNVFRDSRSFFGIRPCGLDARAAFLLDERPSDESFVEIGHALERAILSRFWL